VIGISVGLWGAELLTIRAARIMLAATVFVIGVLTGAGVAAWMMPPV
jgi:precorrin-2 methylase